jgi:hypothetical protein
MSDELKTKSIIILDDDRQITIDGDINIDEVIGINLQKEIEEVVDDCLVKCYTVINAEAGKVGKVIR